MRFINILIITFFLFSCNKYEEDILNTEERQNITLIYMIADNDLSPFALNDINEMEKGYNAVKNEKILIYIDSSPILGLPKNPVLLELQHDETEKIKSKIIYSYPPQNSTDKKNFKMIIEDALNYNRIKNKTKGLVLWSHGNSWLPEKYDVLNGKNSAPNSYKNEKILFKSFGKDYSPKESVMEIDELASVLNNYHFNYIIFDACYMSSVEVVYEFKNSTNFIVASPSEVLSDGFPYEKTISRLLKKKVNLKGVCEDFYNHYNKKTGVFKSASITLLNTSYLDDFALYCNKNLKPKKKINNLDNIQQYTRNNEKLLFDLKSILDNEDLKYPNWDKLILYENHTENIANLSLKNCNGLSAFIFRKNTELNEYYKELSWYKETNFSPSCNQ